MKTIYLILLLVTVSSIAQQKLTLDSIYVKKKNSFFVSDGLVFSTKLSLNKNSVEVLKVDMNDKVFFIPKYFCTCKECLEYKGMKELKLRTNE